RRVLQNISVNDMHMRSAGEALAQRLDQAAVEFHGDQAPGAFGQNIGQHARAGADFQHGIAGAEFGRIQDRRQITPVRQIVLTERLLGWCSTHLLSPTPKQTAADLADEADLHGSFIREYPLNPPSPRPISFLYGSTYSSSRLSTDMKASWGISTE